MLEESGGGCCSDENWKRQLFLRVQLVYDKVTLVNVAENVNFCVNLE